MVYATDSLKHSTQRGKLGFALEQQRSAGRLRDVGRLSSSQRVPSDISMTGKPHTIRRVNEIGTVLLEREKNDNLHKRATKKVLKGRYFRCQQKKKKKREKKKRPRT